MARRKGGFLSDGSDSEQSDADASEDGYNSHEEDEDARAERALFERNSKRQKLGGKTGKEGAWEGIFGDDDDQPALQSKGLGARNGRGGIGSGGRTDWTKAPVFVSNEKVSPKPKSPSSEENVEDSTKAPSKVPDKPMVFGTTATTSSLAENNARIRFTPSRSSTPTTLSKKHELTRDEATHFGKISNNFGAKMLAKLGWAPGKGLGVNEDGRAVPIAVGRHMRGEGIKSGVRSDDSKREARRRGELDEDEDEDKEGRKKKPVKPVARAAQDGWKKQKRVKIKVQHKTYEQLLVEEVGDITRSGVGIVLDARGGELREVASLADLSLSHWTPTSDTTQLPELRHNMRLILDMTKGEVGNLVREGKSVNERRRWNLREEERARQKVETIERDIARLEEIDSKVRYIADISVKESKQPRPSLQPLEEAFNDLIIGYKSEYISFALDDVVVGAIDMILRRDFATWQPFDLSSDALLSSLKQWRKGFNLSTADDLPVERSHNAPRDAEQTMTAWESLLWHRWLPKVRSAINNEWDPNEPQSAVHLLESWDSLLPSFIRDNVVDQLILPKIKAAVEQWDGRAKGGKKMVSLASIIFPWLPLLGERVEDVLEEGKRRIRSVLRKWKITDGVLDELSRWKKDIYSSSEWDKLIGEHVLGKLGASLRDDFIVNPRNQDLAPLVQWIFPWHTLVRSSNFARLFELEFFPKWLNVLYLWLVHPGYSGDEVVRWFEMWKDIFPSELLKNKNISDGFDCGLELMDKAMTLGAEAPSKLQRPQYEPKSSSRPSSTSAKPHKAAIRRLVDTDPRRGEITFRSIAEDFISAKDLLLLPLGRSHTITGKPLFRVGKTVDGKGGVTVYIGEDAVFAQNDEGQYRALSLDDLVKRIT